MRKEFLSGILTAGMLFGGVFSSTLTTLGAVAAAYDEDGGWEEAVEPEEPNEEQYDSVTFDNVVYIIDLVSKTASVGSYSGTATEVTIRSAVTYGSVTYAVTSVGKNAFFNEVTWENDTLEKVIIPEGITSLGANCFEYCTALKSVELPISVNTVGGTAFYGCSSLAEVFYKGTTSDWEGINIYDYNSPLENAVIHCSDDIINMGLSYGSKDYNAYTAKVSSCSQSKASIIKIPMKTGEFTVTGIGSSAFYNFTELKEITIPKTVTSIGKNAFYGCSKLKDVHFEGTKEEWNLVGIETGNSYLKSATVSFAGTSQDPDKPPHEHTFKEVVTKPATCQETGTMTKTCTICGAVSTSTISKLPHQLGNWETTTPATCTTDGVKTRKCATCTVYETNVIYKTGHNYSAPAYTWSKDHTTCTAQIVCANCKDTISENGTITSGTTPATVISTGLTSYTATFTNPSFPATTDYVQIPKLPFTKPASLKYTSAEKSVTLTWNKAEGVSGYEIQQLKGKSWTTVQTVEQNIDSYKISKLKAKTSYKFRVRSYVKDASGTTYSDYSTIDAKTGISTVKGLKVSKKAATSLTLKWKKNSAASGYEVQINKNGKWKKLKTLSRNNVVNLKVTTLKKNTSYSFRVRTYKTVGKTKYYGAYVTVTGKTKK